MILLLRTIMTIFIFHISLRYSREEPFTALNVEIRNQQHLFESLDAFVKGDLLEGANAYHCEKCDKKVCMYWLEQSLHILYCSCSKHST